MKEGKELIKEAIGFLLRFSGIAWAIRYLFCRNKATIVVYHAPEPEAFRKHIAYLAKHYRFISLDKLVSAIRNKNWSDIPPKAIVITIDDGHKNSHGLLDTIKTFNIRPTIYLCSHIVMTNRHFWFNSTRRPSQALKRIPTDTVIEELTSELGHNPMNEYPDREALSKSEIIEMAPHVDFGSHTKFHPILPQCDDERSRDEIHNSKRTLGEALGRPIEHFAYPNGDYGEREVEYVKRAGHKSARTLNIGWVDVNSDPYRLKAIGIQDDASVNILCGQVVGLFGHLKYLRHGSLDGTRPPFIT
jgi:peptidoglycan/xylan/chitin deacetylase (PgdA/CDA1 family)